eukprot:4647618-Pleurochrysis_carterae.AAC.1
MESREPSGARRGIGTVKRERSPAEKSRRCTGLARLRCSFRAKGQRTGDAHTRRSHATLTRDAHTLRTRRADATGCVLRRGSFDQVEEPLEEKFCSRVADLCSRRACVDSSGGADRAPV